MGPLAEHVVQHPLLVGLLIVMIVAVVVYELRNGVGGGFGVSAGAAVQLINKGAMVIDVRNADAYAAGHIVNARNIQLDQITTERAIAKKQKNKIFITVCDSGMQAGRGAGALRKAGFENSFSLKGGIKAWQEAKLPLVKSK